MATTVTMLLSSLRRLALAKYSVSNFDCFGLAPQQAAPRRLCRSRRRQLNAQLDPLPPTGYAFPLF